ncbi:MAG: NAD(P)-dependent oxidoreductase [Candidatus Cloacimonetes bacterium]|nr:NAD(P)-dependent oxidoreductase [Candidatus Cloacimonadota bacterium]
MSKNILITGAAGFIGNKIVQQLNFRDYNVTLLVRPKTTKKRLTGLSDKAEILELDLRNIPKLRQVLADRKDTDIIHIGAIRNRPKTSKEDYQKANIFATEQLALHAMRNQAKFIFFSSVGVFGTVPESLPPDEQTRKVADNLYHQSKIRAEAIIENYVLRGLNSVIIRPAITYGSGDFGFPYNLIRMIDKNLIVLPAKPPLIHLANVDLLIGAVQKLLITDFEAGKIYNIADRNPVSLLELADVINHELKSREFNRRLIVPNWCFEKAEKFTKMIGNKTWHCRFQLFSKSWFYDVEAAYQDLNLRNIETTTGIRSTIEWYKKGKQSKKH